MTHTPAAPAPPAPAVAREESIPRTILRPATAALEASAPTRRRNAPWRRSAASARRGYPATARPLAAPRRIAGRFAPGRAAAASVGAPAAPPRATQHLPRLLVLAHRVDEEARRQRRLPRQRRRRRAHRPRVEHRVDLHRRVDLSFGSWGAFEGPRGRRRRRGGRRRRRRVAAASASPSARGPARRTRATGRRARTARSRR